MPKLVFLQDIPLRGDDLVDRTYEYGSDKNFNATYSVVNIYDLQNNIIGEGRYDFKIENRLGGFELTFNAVLKCSCISGLKSL